MIQIKDILQYLDSIGIKYTFCGDVGQRIEGFSSLKRYVPGTMSWIKSSVSTGVSSGLSLVFVSPEVIIKESNVIVTEDSKRAFFSSIEYFFGNKRENPGVGAGTYLSEDVKIGKNVSIGYNCVIDGDITIGDDTVIYNNVSIINKANIGRKCTIQSGTSIGQDGFGYTQDEKGKKHMIDHYGGTYIGDDVFIGPNCVIYRGTIDDTVIGDGSKIDGLCHIGHNGHIGEDVVLIAGTILYGSVEIGDKAYIASAVIRNQITVGENAVIGMGSVVTKNVEPNTTVMGVPAKRNKETL